MTVETIQDFSGRIISMKRIIFSILACASLLAGCTLNDAELKNGSAMPFSAEIDQDLTKVSIDNFQLSWAAGETVWAAAMDAPYTGGSISVPKAGTYRTSAAGSISRLDYVSGDALDLTDITAKGAGFIAFSPASVVSMVNGNALLTLPSTQTDIAGGVKEFPMVGFSAANPTEMKLDFSPICGVLKFKLRGSKASTVLRSISLSANEDLCGPAELTNTDGIWSSRVSGGSKTVNLNCGAGVALSTGEDKLFYICLPEGTYTGMKIVFNFADGGSQTFTSGGNDIDIAVNKLYTIGLAVESKITVPVGAKAVLPSGSQFNILVKRLIAANPSIINAATIDDFKVQKIVFETNSAKTSGTEIQASESDVKIYISSEQVVSIHPKAPFQFIVTVSTPADQIYVNDDASSMFRAFYGLTEIENIEYLNTEEVTDMSKMFYMADGTLKVGIDSSGFALRKLDLSSFNTGNVTTMESMFSKCWNLEELDLSGFDTSNLTDMSSMFSNCNSLRSLDLSGFTTESVTSMSRTFYHCWGLTELDLSSFNTENVTDFSYMFWWCRNITKLDVTSFNTASATTMVHMFNSLYKLRKLDLSSFSCKSLTLGSDRINGLDYFFNQCGALEELWLGEDFGSDPAHPCVSNAVATLPCSEVNNRTCLCNTTGTLIVHCTQDVANWFARTGFRWVNSGWNGTGAASVKPVPVTFLDLNTGRKLSVTWREN